jgi:hypothetical protein
VDLRRGKKRRTKNEERREKSEERKVKNEERNFFLLFSFFPLLFSFFPLPSRKTSRRLEAPLLIRRRKIDPHEFIRASIL